jgi:hypothetical protein
MNRIVIVGNGFDIAHNVKTKYEDFLYDYFINAIKQFEKFRAYEDELMTFKFKNLIILSENTLISNTLKSLNDIFKCRFINWNLKDYEISDRNTSQIFFTVEFKSDFFKSMLELNKWSDIEKYYFDYLIKDYQNKSHVGNLNLHFEIIKSKFFDYISNLDFSEFTLRQNLSKIMFIDSCFEDISKELYKQKFKSQINFSISEDQLKVNSVLFLNFNYTSLLDNYLNLMENSSKSKKHFKIHGEISNFKSIVFGYGDDTHSKYSELENEDDENLLKHIKSFYYPNNSQYNQIIDFIESESFEVVVVGHSLGLSDRVLLKTIFENKNCRNIRIYHRGTIENHFKKRIALSRHFSDKISMRRKIEEFDKRCVFE